VAFANSENSSLVSLIFACEQKQLTQSSEPIHASPSSLQPQINRKTRHTLQ
jgi:hypothetical protein